MTKIPDLVQQMRDNPTNVRFDDLCKVCEAYFGQSRSTGSHRIYKTPWQGDPRVNIQEGDNGKAKAYQVRQVLQAIARLEEESRS